MIVTYKWLKEFVNIPVKPEELSEIFPKIGIELDNFSYMGANLSNIVVAHVEECEKHPDADKLSICKVNDGREIHQVICGAPNVSKNKKVVFAQIGANLPGDFKIKKAKIRGVESSGMLCSAKELGFSEESEGIILLPEHAPIGTSIIDYYEKDDYIYSLETFANRPDHMGVMGIARDLSIYFDTDFITKEKLTEVKADSAEKVFEVEIKNIESCPRYVGRYVTNIQNVSTPQYMKNRLLACGLRSINFLVDVTNYVMLETGHPMHGFNSSFFPDKKVIIRNSEKTKFNALNEKEYELDENDLVIANSKEAVAVAGIIGGANSELKDNSSEIFLESAFFNNETTAITSRKIGLRTDSSARFEKKANVEMTYYAMNLASFLIKQNINQANFYEIIDNYALKQKKNTVKLKLESVEKKLGYTIPENKIASIIKRLPLNEISKGEYEVDFSRSDIEIEEDIIEELAKFYGYENIPDKEIKMVSTPYYNSMEKYIKLAHKMAANGFQEVLNYSFVPEKHGDSASLKNPLSEDFGHMRVNMWDGLIKNIEYNAKRGCENHLYFEKGRIYRETENGFEEKNIIAAVAAGNIYENYGESVKVDYYFLKGVVENLLFGKNPTFEEVTDFEILHPGVSAKILINGVTAGYIGKLHPSVKSKFFTEAFYFEIYPDSIPDKRELNIRTISRFPSVKFDLSLIVPEKVKYSEIRKIIDDLKIRELDSIELYSHYRGDNLPPDTRSLTFRMRFSDVEKTLSDN
ncbi:MAG: phenylalanine--tRNA ligase subunit beta, partial [Candidatus Muiribacteriota bacterium]